MVIFKQQNSGEDEVGRGVGVEGCRAEKKSTPPPHLAVRCLSSLWGVSGTLYMGSSKEEREERVLALLTDIKRLRRASPARIMEYGISHPAHDSVNE